MYEEQLLISVCAYGLSVQTICCPYEPSTETQVHVRKEGKQEDDDGPVSFTAASCGSFIIVEALIEVMKQSYIHIWHCSLKHTK